MNLILLLDLDDTLLHTNQSAFIPAYFQALTQHLAPQVAPEVMMRALLAGTNAMNLSEDFSRPLAEVFDSVFLPQIGLSREAIMPAVERFYDEVFPTLQRLTSPKPEAKPFVEWARAQGYRLVVATDPLLPRKANLHRIRWAGLDPAQFEIVSSYEHFSFTKTHAAYYAETLGRLGWADSPILMVGNDWERDIAPAQKLGVAAYFLNGETPPPSETIPHGTLSDLRQWLETADLSALIPSFQSRDSVLAILAAAPAALNGLTRALQADDWRRKPAPDEWSLTELVCHLRDSEREIHHPQIKLFREQEEPFIPRPNTDVWASQRNYLHEDGARALREFNDARRETLRLLRDLTESDWNRKGRHAIFGPTTFFETARFIAEHDRLHIRQAWEILHKA